MRLRASGLRLSPSAGQPAEYVADFPTLFVALDWIEAHCVVPDGFQRGAPFQMVDWQAWCLLNFYRVKPSAVWVPSAPVLAPAFHYRRSQIVLPQKAGKAPYTAAHICCEGVGPALFGGWAAGGERWDCRDHGCSCGFVYEYEPGEPMGIAWPTPLIQITATSEEQTDNIYDALRPMIEQGPLAELIPKTGEEFIRLPGGGRIDVVTSSARSRLGQRVTYCPQDETGIWTPTSGMVKVAHTQRRGLSGMGGRAEETTNAWDPAEDSVAQQTAESKATDVFRFHPEASASLAYKDEAQRRQIHEVVYLGSHWVDLDAIAAEAAELVENDPAQAERFYGNRVVAGEDRAFDRDVFRGLARNEGIARGRLVTLGFDGALHFDATGLVATDVESGHQVVVGWWFRPPHLADADEWRVPAGELDEAVAFAFGEWDVWRMYGDPPYYTEELDRWAGRYGKERVMEWWTNRRKPMGHALKRFRVDMQPGVMSHGPRDSSDRSREAHTALVEHVGNAIRRPTNIRNEDDTATGDRFLWLISKEQPSSRLKIDLCMAAVLSWEARGDAMAAGALRAVDKAVYFF